MSEPKFKVGDTVWVASYPGYINGVVTDFVWGKLYEVKIHLYGMEDVLLREEAYATEEEAYASRTGSL